MSWTFSKLAGLAGLVGSILLIVTILVGVVAPNTGIPPAPFFGAGAVLLGIAMFGLLTTSANRLGLLGKAGLIISLIALLWLSVYAVLSIILGETSATLDGLWVFNIVALLLLTGGLAAYGANALTVKAVPSWAGVPMVLAGTILLLDFAVWGAISVLAGSNPSGTVNTAQQLIFQLAIALSILSCGAAGLALILRSDMEWGVARDATSTPSSVPKPST